MQIEFTTLELSQIIDELVRADTRFKKEDERLLSLDGHVFASGFKESYEDEIQAFYPEEELGSRHGPETILLQRSPNGEVYAYYLVTIVAADNLGFVKHIDTVHANLDSIMDDVAGFLESGGHSWWRIPRVVPNIGGTKNSPQVGLLVCFNF